MWRNDGSPFGSRVALRAPTRLVAQGSALSSLHGELEVIFDGENNSHSSDRRTCCIRGLLNHLAGGNPTGEIVTGSCDPVLWGQLEGMPALPAVFHLLYMLPNGLFQTLHIHEERRRCTHTSHIWPRGTYCEGTDKQRRLIMKYLIYRFVHTHILYNYINREQKKIKS